MYIFNVFNDSNVKDVVVEYLKCKGVKYKAQKKPKDVPQSVPSAAVFQTPIRCLRQVGVSLKDGKVMVEVPEFLAEVCCAIEQNIHVEGIFRKGGSSSKQRDLKQLINSGLPLPDNCHVVDACNLVKLFLRELPEPLIPYYTHETLLSCLLLSTEKAQREALLLSCLLINREQLQVLAYILEFLVKVAQNSALNKMDIKNLAIVLTPSLMPMDSKVKQRCNFNISHHIAVVELLIKSAADVGTVPEVIAEQALARRSRKRRSASITRMFTGIRKIVGRGSPTRDATPPIEHLAQKRKSPEILPPAVTVKRRREMADTTPRLCRMGGYSRASLVKPDEITDENNSPEQAKEAPLTTKRATSRKGGRKPVLKPSKSTSNLLMSKKKTLERKLSSMTWGKRRPSIKTDVSPNNPEEPELDEVVTIPRKEYEDMMTRVTCMEKLLQEKISENGEETKCDSDQLADQLNKDLRIRWSSEVKNNPASPATAVQEAFERTVEHTEQLAPQMRKDMRLRWSSERVARSPSERKIGSIRRRSRELARSNSSGAKPSLQRGRPNTRQTGLRTPTELSHPRSKDEGQEQWRPGSAVFASPSLMNRMRGSPQKRDSIASLRKNNIGMVHAKAKFFDSLNHSTDGESDRSNQSMERRLRSVQLEMQRLKEQEPKVKRQPTIKAPLVIPNGQLKTPRSVARSTTRSRVTPLKALPDSTPIRGLRRSPRILSRTMSLHTSTKSP